MTVAIKSMVWDPTLVGWRDDSFVTGWTPDEDIDFTKIDGDFAELVVKGGETFGFIQKAISVDASIYKYLVVGLWGDGDYRISVYDGEWHEVLDPFGWIDAPNTYDIKVVDLTEITTGTITQIVLYTGQAAAKKTTYDFIEFHSAEPEEPSAIVALNVLQREAEADTFESRWVEGVSDPFTKGFNIRLIATRDTNADKIFAGVIEESNLLGGGHLRDVSGRCFQVKLQSATKTVTFSDDELSAAVKELVEDLTEVTTERVETPDPVINIRKKYTATHIGDALNQLASLPSKQDPFEPWRWKLGYGQDLRVRSVLSSNVRECITDIVEGTNILTPGVKLGSDLYGLYNKVVAYSGIVYLPYTDDYTEDFNDWAIESCTDCVGAFLQNGAAIEGDNSIQFVATEVRGVRIKSDLGSAIDTTQMTRIIFQVQVMPTFPYDKLTIYFGQDYDNCYYKEFTIVVENNLWNQIALDLEGWSTRGTPTRTDVDYLAIGCVLPNLYLGSIWWDGLHFVAPKIEATAVDDSSPVDHDRVYFYKDAKINEEDKLQDFADGLLETLKAAAERIQLPVTGAPDLQRGRKVTATSATLGLDGDYIIAEAEHIFSRGVGYTTIVLLDEGRYSLPSELKTTLEQELQIERRGTIPDSLAEAGAAPQPGGIIDLDRIPTPLTGKSADMLDGYHETSFGRLDAERTWTENITIEKETPKVIFKDTALDATTDWDIRAIRYGGSDWLWFYNEVDDRGVYIRSDGQLECHQQFIVRNPGGGDPGDWVYLMLEATGLDQDDWTFINDGEDLSLESQGAGLFKIANEVRAPGIGAEDYAVFVIRSGGLYIDIDGTFRWTVEGDPSPGDLLPFASNVYNIGGPGNLVKDLYATTLHGALTGEEITSGTIALARLPTMDDGHIPNLETLSYGGAFAVAQIPVLSNAKYPNAILRDGSRSLTGDLLPDGDGTRDLGSIIKRYDNVFTKKVSAESAVLGLYGDSGLYLGADEAWRWSLTGLPGVGHLIPEDNNAYDIGSALKKVKDLHAVTLHGALTTAELTGHTKAVHDALKVYATYK